MKRTLVLCMVGLVGLVLLVGPVFAGGRAEVDPDAAEIAVVVKIEGIPWFARMEEGIRRAADEFGVNAYMMGPADAEAAPQVEIIEDLIERGVDAIAVVPNDPLAMEPVVRRAREAGIIVLTHENPFEDQMVDWNFETIDSDAYGRAPIEAFVEYLQETGEIDRYDEDNPAGIVHLVGSLEVPLHNYWADVATEYMESEYPFIRVITDRLPTAESVEDSRDAVLDLHRTYGDRLRAVIGWGSLGPIGGAQAVEELGIADELWIGGSALPGTVASYLDRGSVKYAQLWDPADAGYGLVYIALQMIEGEEIVEGMDIPGLGPIGITGNTLFVEAAAQMYDAQTARELGF